MKSIKLLIFTCFLFPLFVISQKDYDTGYIITNRNDTIIGFVKERKQPPFGKLFKKVYFKNNDEKRKYSPKQILGYKQGNREFESIWLDISGHLIEENYISKPNFGAKLFLKVDLRGYLTLYQMEIEDPESDYIDQIPLFKRKDENYLLRVTQGMFGLKKKKLKKYFKDNPELVNKIEKNELKTPIEIANFYNTWRVKTP